MKNYMHVADMLFNQPLLLSEGKLNAIINAFSDRAAIRIDHAGSQQADEDFSDEQRRRAGYRMQGRNGIIGIYGPMVHRRLGMDFVSGGPTSYGDIRHAVDTALADDAVDSVVLDIDSPGGEVNGAFDLADHIYESRGVKPIIAVVNERALSAGYLLASAADKIVMPRTGEAGSIGVIATHADYSQAEQDAGIQVTHIYAGDRKADLSPHAPLSSTAQSHLQACVDETYDLFVDTVVRNRGLSSQQVRDTQAQFFKASQALQVGLIDEIGAASIALATAGSRSISQNHAQETVMTLDELQQNHPDLVSQIQEQARQGMVDQADVDAAKAQAAQDEGQRLMGLVSAAVGDDIAGRIQTAADKGLSADDLSQLGVSLAPQQQQVASQTQQQMLEAITVAASQGVQADGVPAPDQQQQQIVSALASAGSDK